MHQKGARVCSSIERYIQEYAKSSCGDDLRYQDLFLAHYAFYKYEKKAKYYDIFQNSKKEELWNTPDPQDTEISKLLKFIRRWDHHFRGEELLFKEAYASVFDEINHLKDKTFHEMDILERNNHICIQNIINAFSTCNNAGRYESTDATKMAHALMPNLFVMWDRKIRAGTIGDANHNRAENYVMNFLPRMKIELQDLIKSCKTDKKTPDKEIIKTIEMVCHGKTITKLLDQFNYMTYTMPTEYNMHVSEVKDNVPSHIWTDGLYESLDFWTEHIGSGKGTDDELRKEFIGILNKLQKTGHMASKERQDWWVKYRNGSREERDWLFNELTEKYNLKESE